MKTRLLIFFVTLAFISCQKEGLTPIEVEEVYGDPEEKLQEFQAVIDANKDWEFLVENRMGTVSYGYLGFENNSSADFLSSVNDDFAEVSTTDYRLAVVKTNPSLIFPQDSRFSDFAQVAGNVDTLYTFKRMVNDTIFLEGEYRKSFLKLFKTTPEKAQALQSGKIQENNERLADLMALPRFFFRINVGTQSNDVLFDLDAKRITIQRGTDDNIEKQTSSYYVTVDGITFAEEVNLGNGAKLEGLTNFNVITNGLSFAEGSITNEISPVLYNTDDAETLLYDAPTYWVSLYGFSTRTQNDIASMRNIPGYNFFIFWPVYNVNGTTWYDRWGYIVNGNWGAASQASLSGVIAATKMLRFVNYGNFGTTTNPQILNANAVNSSYLYNTMGFYVISSVGGYYMVDARDALTWMFLEE